MTTPKKESPKGVCNECDQEFHLLLAARGPQHERIYVMRTHKKAGRLCKGSGAPPISQQEKANESD